MNLIGYVRVSSASQEDNTSLREQERRIKSYCDAFGHKLTTIFQEVGSGKSMSDRPHFQAAISALNDGADGIIALKLDRIARSCRDVLVLVEDTLGPNNKALILLDLNVDTSTPTGKMVLTVMGAVAELERSQINDRTQGGRRAKAAAGGYAYGAPGYGLRSDGGVLIPIPEQQQVIRTIIDKRATGLSYQKIADYLNQEGITTKRRCRWNSIQVQRVCDRANKRSKQRK